jgi:hypothetical protein
MLGEVLVFATVLARDRVARDVVFYAAGEPQTARVTSCSAASCRIDGKTVRLADVLWIGLGQAGSNPPDANATSDLVYVGGKAEQTRMVGLNSTSVRTTHGRFDRTTVTWIHFAIATKPKDQTPIVGSTYDSGTPATTTTHGGEGGRGGKGGGGGKGPPPPPNLPGARWRGVIAARMVFSRPGPHGVEQRTTVREQVVLREEPEVMRSTDGEVIGTVTRLRSESVALRNEEDGSGETYCVGAGITETAVSGQIFHKTKDRPSPFGSYYEIDPPYGRDFYFVGVPKPDPKTKYDVRCQHKGEWRTGHRTYLGFEAGRNPVRHKLNINNDGEFRYLDSGKMTGTYTNSKVTSNGGSWTLTVQWVICRDGVVCPTLDTDSLVTRKPCGPPDVERALLDPIWNRRQARAQQLKEDWEELQKANPKIVDNLEAWRAAIANCAIEAIGEKLLESFFKKAGGPSVKIGVFVNKIADGDLSAFGGPPGATAKVFKGLEQTAAALVGNPEAMHHQIDNCPALPKDVRDAANAYVDGYAVVQRLLPKVQQEINDIRADDQAYWDQWQKYYQACRDYAICMGKNPDDCPKAPQKP